MRELDLQFAFTAAGVYTQNDISQSITATVQNTAHVTTGAGAKGGLTVTAKDQAAITPKIVAPVRAFYVNRGSRVHKGQLLAVLENRDLAAAETENKGAYEQAQATYGLETASSLPEEWQKAEFDLNTAKENYDAESKVYESRQNLYKQGAMPRKELDASAVSLAQAKAQYELAQQHLAELQKACKQDQLKAA